MLNRRFHLPGLFAVLLALMAQLATASIVPHLDPVAVVGTICHTDDSGDTPAPGHQQECPACPLCGALHVAQHAILPVSSPRVAPRLFAVAANPAMPPPATAPPSRFRPPAQPRAPPFVS